MAKVFRLIVQPTENCMESLRYLNKNILAINSLGAKVVIEKITKDEFDDELVETFRKRGINRLPALIAPDGSPFIGLKQVIDLFEKNLTATRNGNRIGAVSGDGSSGINYGDPATDSEMGSNPDMTDFWMNELYAGTDKRGRNVPRKDKDEDSEDDGADIGRRLAEYERKVPKHRRMGARERDITPATRSTRRQAQESESEDEDNIASEEEEPRPSRGGHKATPRYSGSADGGDAMDQRMLAAWMDNNPGDA